MQVGTEGYCRKDIPSIEVFKLRDCISNTPFASKLFSLTVGVSPGSIMTKVLPSKPFRSILVNKLLPRTGSRTSKALIQPCADVSHVFRHHDKPNNAASRGSIVPSLIEGKAAGLLSPAPHRLVLFLSEGTLTQIQFLPSATAWYPGTITESALIRPNPRRRTVI